MPNPAPMPDLLRGHKRRGLPRLHLAAAVLALGALPAVAADAEPEERRSQYSYKFYVGGVLVGKAAITNTLAGDAYHIASELETDGVAGWFVEAKFNASARGSLSPDAAPSPRTLEVRGVSDNKPWRMTMTYQGDTPSAVAVEPPFRKRHYDIEPTDQKGSLDPISALVAALLPAPRGAKTTPCERTIPIFDGRRRYDVVLEKEISAKDGLIECASRFKRVGGFKEKQLKKDDYLFTTRFEMQADGSAVPVKIWGDTEFGGAVAILRK